MKDKMQQLLEQIPALDAELSFTLLKVENVVMPHPYCITPKHLEYADSMFLNETSIARAEQRGAVCDICRKLVRNGDQPEILSHSAHESHTTLFIQADDNSDLNAVEGLHEYLLSIKPKAESLGIQGFAFPASGTNASED